MGYSTGPQPRCIPDPGAATQHHRVTIFVASSLTRRTCYDRDNLACRVACEADRPAVRIRNQGRSPSLVVGIIRVLGACRVRCVPSLPRHATCTIIQIIGIPGNLSCTKIVSFSGQATESPWLEGRMKGRDRPTVSHFVHNLAGSTTLVSNLSSSTYRFTVFRQTFDAGRRLSC